MIKWVNLWLRGIVIAVIISTIIEMIIPNGNIKKYIKTIIGIYIVFVIISPVISKLTGKEINFAEYVNYQTEKYQLKEIAQIDNNYYIEQTYIENLKKDITREIEQRGYRIAKIQVEIEKEVEYGKINKIELDLLKKDNNIKPIEISANKTEERITNGIEESEKEMIRNFLENNYGVEHKNIIIN